MVVLKALKPPPNSFENYIAEMLPAKNLLPNILLYPRTVDERPIQHYIPLAKHLPLYLSLLPQSCLDVVFAVNACRSA